MLESSVQKKIINYLKKEYKGAVIWKLAEHVLCGVPDIYFAYEGKSFFFEVKRPGGIRRPLQKVTIKKLNSNKIPSYFVESVDEVKEILSKFTS